MCAVEHKIGVYGKYQTLMNLHTAVIGSFARHNKFFLPFHCSSYSFLYFFGSLLSFLFYYTKDFLCNNSAITSNAKNTERQ